jgi:NitT/TauT family transport system substrate-binding protein
MERTTEKIQRPERRWLAKFALLGLVAIPASATPEGPGDGSMTLRVGYQPYFAEAWSGSLLRAQHLQAGRLPHNVTVEFRVGITGGGALVAARRRGDVDLAYLGIAPTLTVTQDVSQGDFRVIAVSSVSHRLCNVILAQSGADVSSVEASLRWLNGRQIAVPRGTCADLFLTDALERGNTKPARILDQAFDVLATSFRERRFDAVAIWEPIASDLVRSASAVRLLSGDALDEASATFLVGTAALLRDHPHVVRAWLDAERVAQRTLAASTPATFPADALMSQAANLSRETISTAWSGPSTSPPTFPLAVTPEVTTPLEHAAERLARRGLLASPRLRAGSIADGAARAVLAAEAESPKGAVRGGR